MEILVDFQNSPGTQLALAIVIDIYLAIVMAIFITLILLIKRRKAISSALHRLWAIINIPPSFPMLLPYPLQTSSEFYIQSIKRTKI